ncbi:MAG: Ig-like domain-containing protein [Fibrobacteraceae bacterium]|nr:Ig-like domain-containing protein [Fibrobacteraceae bacterium]
MNVNKSLVAFLVAAASTFSLAANAVVWSDEAETTAATTPAYFYTYPEPGEAGGIVDTTNADGVWYVDAELDTTKDASVGFGFGWSTTATGVKSLSSYKSAVLRYKAEQGFRIDFKQSNIKDYNYYGAEIAAAKETTERCINFADLTQGWKATTTVAFSAATQTGVQFAFKSNHAKNGVKTNSIVLNSLEFSSATCPVFAPEVLPPYDAPEAIDMNEGDTLRFVMSEMFQDKDDATLNITLVIADTTALKVANKKSIYSLTDEIILVTKPNVSKSSKITITAKDSKAQTAVYTNTITVTDRENPPVAVDDEFEVKEDSVLTVGLTKGLLRNDYDADESTLTATILGYTEPAYGTLALKPNGTFTYTPAAGFSGVDSFKYVLIDASDLESDSATVTIKVTHVNHAPVLKIVNADAFALISSVEDVLDEQAITFTTADVSIADADNDSLFWKVTTDKKIKYVGQTASYDEDGVGTFSILYTQVEDACDTSTVTICLTDGVATATTCIKQKIYMKGVLDNPKGVADAYEVKAGKKNVIDSTKGVLKNDLNPDGLKGKFHASLVEPPSYGKLELKENGGFTYTADADYEGEDLFSYLVWVVEGKDTLKSEETLVTLTVVPNSAPVVVVDESTLDTTAQEDFTKAITYAAARVKGWFQVPSGSTASYSAKSDDGKVSASIVSGALQIKSVKDSCGDAYVTINAAIKTDTASVRLHILIEPVNDKPVQIKKDTILVKYDTAWVAKVNMNELVSDIEGDSLVFKENLSDAVKRMVKLEIEDSIVTVTPKDSTVRFTEGTALTVAVKAIDAADTSSNVLVTFTIKFVKNVSIQPAVVIAPMNWQNAIAAKQGSATLFDMQGRKLWSSKLPANEDDVRRAVNATYGNKVLRVNNRQWIFR